MSSSKIKPQSTPLKVDLTESDNELELAKVHNEALALVSQNYFHLYVALHLHHASEPYKKSWLESFGYSLSLPDFLMHLPCVHLNPFSLVRSLILYPCFKLKYIQFRTYFIMVYENCYACGLDL